MRAAYITDLGPAEDIRFGVLDDPEPGPDDVLIDVRATTVNPVDTLVRSGVYSTPLPFPFVIGRDLVGTVAATGSNVRGFTEGELVWSGSMGHDGRQGAAAERVAVPAGRVYHLPDGVDPLQAVAVAHPAATAHLALFRHGGLRAGQTVVVVGGGGNVGGAATALAAGEGARVVAVAGPADAPYCRSVGARAVVDYTSERLTEQLHAACPDGVDVYVDASGVNDLGLAVDLLAVRGRIVLLAGVRSRPVLPAGQLYMKDGSIAGFVISRADAADLADAAGTINRLLARGALAPKAVETAPLSSAAEAHARMERGECRGKRIVLLTG